MIRLSCPLFPIRILVIAVLVILALAPGRRADAQNCAVACVLAGPRLASMDSSRSALLDPVLSGLLGSDLALNVLDWNALAQGDVNLLGLLGESGAQLGLSEPSQVRSAQTTLLGVVSAAGAVAAADGDTALVSALGALEVPLAGLGGQIRLGDLLAIDLPQGALAEIELNALDLVTGAIQLYNHRNVVTTPRPITLDNQLLRALGVGGGEILLQVVEPPVLRCGPEGTQFHSAAIRAHARLDLADLAVDAGPLNAALPALLNASAGIELAQIDLYLEIARVEGAVRRIDTSARGVDVELSPAIGDLYLGAIDPGVFFNRGRPLGEADVSHGQVGELEIALTGGLVRKRARIQARAIARGSPAAAQVMQLFAPFPARGSVAQGAASLGFLAASLASNLDVEVEETLGLSLDPLVDTVIEPVVNDVIGGVLTGTVTPVLAQTVDPLLELLGLRLGEGVAEVRAITSGCRDTGDCPLSGPAPNGTDIARYGIADHGILDGMGMGGLDPDDETTRTSAGDDQAQGDDLSGSDDEDGLASQDWPRGSRLDLHLELRAAGVGYLQAWVDWHGDGQFDAGDRIARDLTPGADGIAVLTVAIPSRAREGATYARFRWSSAPSLGPSGPAPDGEVEDHRITITAPSQISLSGRVFADDGAAGAAIAHDGKRQVGELALQNVQLQAFAPDGRLVASGLSDTAGTWQLAVPAEAAGNVILMVLPPDGWRSITEAPEAPPAKEEGRVDDGQMTLAVVPGDVLGGLDFGLVPRARLAADLSQVLLQAGQRRDLPYRLTAGSPLHLDLTLAVTEATPAGALSVVLMHDADCDGTGDGPIRDTFELEAGEDFCAVARLQAGSGAPDRSTLRYDFLALGTYARTATADEIRLPATVKIGTALAIAETVQNLTRMTPEGTKNRAGPGDFLIYRLTLENVSAEPLDDVRTMVLTPVFTVLDKPLPARVARDDSADCELISPLEPRVGFRGLLRWRCPGQMAPGEIVVLSYVVRVLN